MEKQEIPIPANDVKTTLEVVAKIINNRNLPQSIFNEFQKAFGGTSLEVVPIKFDATGNIQVFLTQRPMSDPYWPGDYHVPGTMIFPWDLELKDGFDEGWARLMSKEIMSSEHVSSVSSVETLSLKTRRGAETAVVHNLVFRDDPGGIKGGEWFDINDLPKNLVEHHHQIIFTGIHDFVSSVIVEGQYTNSRITEETKIGMLRNITKHHRK